ncbi:hypothetical protein ACMFEO_04465 [Escherichia coli]
MVKKSLRQFTLMATATVTLLLGSVPLYAQISIDSHNLSSLMRTLSHIYNIELLLLASC